MTAGKVSKIILTRTNIKQKQFNQAMTYGHCNLFYTILVKGNVPLPILVPKNKQQ